MTKVKICGLKRSQDIGYVNEAKPDFAGFIVHVQKSKRNVDVSQLEVLTAQLDPQIIPVGIFVDEDPSLVLSLVQRGIIRAVQLHGHEDETYVRQMREALLQCKGNPLLIQAFKVRTREDVERANQSCAQLVLLDGGAGEGKTFDWRLLKEAKRPYLLAGGLGEENLREAIAQCHPYGVDLSSGAETNGVKDGEKIRRIVSLVRRL